MRRVAIGRFLTRLRIETASDQDDGKWIVLSPLVYQSGVAGMEIAVPAGFETDLASVPRLPFVYWLTGGTSVEAAVVHDYLYSTHLVCRKMADAVLREASAATGVPAWRRWLMWAGTRIGGASRWEPGQTTAIP